MISFKDLKVKIVKEEGNKGTYEISPLYRGYGHTLANSLRRILLSSLEGAAVTSIKVNGVKHEYSTIEGVKEDVVEIILNLKALRFKCTSDDPQICTLEVSGQKEATGGDIKVTGDVEVVTPDLPVATLTEKGSSLSMEIVVEKGVGYKAAEENDRAEVSRIPIDSDFTPVLSVSYDVGATRRGQETDLDAVTFEIETDGSIKPVDALLEAAKILQDFAGKVMVALGVPVTEVEAMAEASKESSEAAAGEAEGEQDEVSSWKVEDLPISKRSKTGLLSGGFETVGDLANASTTDLMGLQGFGNKSLIEVVELLNQYGIELKTE